MIMDRSEFFDILFVLASVLSTLMALFVVTYTLYRNKIKKRDSLNVPHLSYQRELLENSVYKSVEELTKDSINFLDTNHLILDASNNNNLKSNKDVPNLSYFNDLGIVGDEFIVKDRQIICLMPFNNKYSSLYDTIKTCCKFNGYDCMRTDEEKIESNVNLRKYIVTKIIQAQIVVAVLDGRNPNVLYEVGIAHAIGKLVILLVKRDKSNDLPENLKGNRLLIYKSENDLFEQLSGTLNSVEYA